MDEWRCSGKDVGENRWMRRQVFEANVCWALDEDRFLFVAQRGHCGRESRRARAEVYLFEQSGTAAAAGPSKSRERTAYRLFSSGRSLELSG